MGFSVKTQGIYLLCFFQFLQPLPFKIVSGAIALNREQDCGIGQALKEASKPMVKFILLIAIVGISISLLWNFLFSFLTAQC